MTMKSNLRDSDIPKLKEKKINPEQMIAYRQDLEQGFPYVNLHSNATIGKEIRRYDPAQLNSKKTVYTKRDDLKVVKFVPASGAASRMFKDLFAALNDGESNEAVSTFFTELHKFAFFDRLISESGVSKKESYTDEEKVKILETLLLPEGMNYGDLPKGSIEFHSYEEGRNRSAFEEHFYEAKLYAEKDGKAQIHFTIPADQKAELDECLVGLSQSLTKSLDVDFTVHTSVQKPQTDTPAIYIESGDWARMEDGSLLFRPAGHGALLENLNEIDADLIFVKNIDNVVPDRSKAETATYKELLAGVLIEIQDKTFKFLEDWETGNFNSNEAKTFLEETFSLNADSLSNQELVELLNRPIRVCGMVKNQGEPGGGPFIVEEDGKTSLQIVEKAQINLENEAQKSILETATHFNPVDLVLGVRDFKGNKFDLLEFRNPKTGMRVEKTLQGKPIYALELPGLWNGAMYFWNTVFVEVPIGTFNPVKTVLDLVRPAHLS